MKGEELVEELRKHYLAYKIHGWWYVPLSVVEEYLKDKIRGIEGFNIPNARLLHRTLRFDCYYINELGQKDRIMLEFYLTTTKWRKIKKRVN